MVVLKVMVRECGSTRCVVGGHGGVYRAVRVGRSESLKRAWTRVGRRVG